MRRALAHTVLYRELIVVVKGLPEPCWDKNKLSELTGLSADVFRNHSAAWFLIFRHKKDVKDNLTAIDGGFSKTHMRENKKVKGAILFHQKNRNKMVECLSEGTDCFSCKWSKHLRVIFSGLWDTVKQLSEAE